MDDNFQIRKKEINLQKIELYNQKKIWQSRKILKDVIENVVVNDFSFMLTLQKIARSKNQTIEEAYEQYQSNVPVKDCIGLSKILKERLDSIGLQTHFVTCKASGFSTKYGDSLIKEAHTFLIYPCIKEGHIFFVLYDPGFRVTEPLSFYAGASSFTYPYLNGTIKVNLQNNEYMLQSNVRMKRDFSIVPETISFSFQPFYETLDINAFAKNVFRVKFSYKIMNYAKEIQKRYCLGLNIVTKQLEIYTSHHHCKYSLEEFLNLSQMEQLNQFSFLTEENQFSKQNILELLELFKVYNQEKIPILEKKIIQDWNR